MLDAVEIDGYSQLVKIGEGGMAQVYRGIQDSLQRPVAIKLLINDLCEDEEARLRFERESYIIARLNHANIIHIIDRGITRNDIPYFVMEFVEGTELSTAVKIRNVSMPEKIDILLQVLKALSYAHRNNVIHRDVKPDNILLDDDNNVKILDFGIAQFYEDRQKAKDLTVTGTIMGTYNYMSPEQRESADNVTVKSDLYSVGVVMYELFTGRLPSGRFPNPSEMNPEVNPQLDELILSCLQQDPENRPDSAESVKVQLLAISQGAHIDGARKQRAERGITRIKSRFLLLDILREDKFGSIYLYQQKEKGTLLVIKKKISDENGYSASKVLSSLQHPHIVNTLGSFKTEEYFVLVQEYLSGGTLQDKLSFQLSWSETLRMASEICRGLMFAHKHGVVHGHLRPTNILFTRDGHVKLTDFSLKDDLADVMAAHHYSLDGETPSIESDIYSTGVILYQLFTGCLPNRTEDDKFIVRKFFAKLPEDIQELIVNMISTVPANRDADSLQKAVLVFEKHSKAKPGKAFTEVAAHDKNTDKPDGAKNKTRANTTTVTRNLRPAPSSYRVSLLIGVVVLVIMQFLFLFDGGREFSNALPVLYERILGQTNATPDQLYVATSSSLHHRG